MITLQLYFLFLTTAHIVALPTVFAVTFLLVKLLLPFIIFNPFKVSLYHTFNV